MHSSFEYQKMISPLPKASIVKPLSEKNDFDVLQKGYGYNKLPFQKRKDHYDIYGKESEVIKSLVDDRKENVLMLDSAYSQLHSELEEIQKWKNLIAIENKEKDKKIEEYMLSTEEQRKISLNFQLQNENLSLQLVEETQQRSFVSEKLHATKEMYSALKRHINTLQNHFEYRNRIEEMIKVSDSKRCLEIENLKDMFQKRQIKQAEKIEYLSCALGDETNKKERLELQFRKIESEREALSSMVRKYENEVESLGKLINAEKSNAQLLQSEKTKLESDLIQLQNSNKYYDALLKEKEEVLEKTKQSKEETESKLNSQISLVKALEEKCEELLETNAALCEETNDVSDLKQTNEDLYNKIINLEKSLKEEENKNQELFSCLQTLEKEKCYFEQKTTEDGLKLIDFDNLQVKYQEEVQTNASLLKEIGEVELKLKDSSIKLQELKSEKEQLLTLNEEKSELINTLKKEFETKLESEGEKFTRIHSEYDQLSKTLMDREEKLVESEKISAELQEKIHEVEALKVTLTKTENELNVQNSSTYDVLKLLQDTEAKFNRDRLAKESELLSCKEEVRKLEFEMKLLKCEVEELEKVKSENLKLNEDIEKLRLQISESSRKEEELKKKIQSNNKKRTKTANRSTEMKPEDVLKFMRVDSSEPEKEKDVSKTFLMHVDDGENSNELEEKTKAELSRNEKYIHGIENRNWDSESSSSENHELVHDQPSRGIRFLEAHRKEKETISNRYESLKLQNKERETMPDVRNKKWEIDSSGSECLEFVYNEGTKSDDKAVSDAKNKKWEVESSSSECLELVYDEKSNNAVGLCKANSKSDFGTRTPNEESKILPFKTKRKRESQSVSQEDIIRKKMGLPPRKTMGYSQLLASVPTQVMTPRKIPDLMKFNARVESSPWRSAVPKENKTFTPIQRKFFKKPTEDRDALKKPSTYKPWF